ncbi:MAG: VWA domain-containing protein [Candidatus Peribacteraceae bacterium]|nr:VWA domain-containing protein [Candidatus Peribacteraceae bacterium]
MKKDFSEIVCIVDKSGSMGSIVNDAIGGFNTFIKAQQDLPGAANVTLVLFDTSYNIMVNGENLKEFPELTKRTYVPGGGTALYDAIGKAINVVGKRLSDTPEAERPEKVIFGILTDGEENSSREFDKDKIMEMISHQKATYSWEFVFLAANQDAMAAGGSIGISANDTFNFAATGVGVKKGYVNMTRSLGAYRGADSESIASAIDDNFGDIDNGGSDN